jgi:hypothetical protein
MKRGGLDPFTAVETGLARKGLTVRSLLVLRTKATQDRYYKNSTRCVWLSSSSSSSLSSRLWRAFLPRTFRQTKLFIYPPVSYFRVAVFLSGLQQSIALKATYRLEGHVRKSTSGRLKAFLLMCDEQCPGCVGWSSQQTQHRYISQRNTNSRRRLAGSSSSSRNYPYRKTSPGQY